MLRGADLEHFFNPILKAARELLPSSGKEILQMKSPLPPKSSADIPSESLTLSFDDRHRRQEETPYVAATADIILIKDDTSSAAEVLQLPGVAAEEYSGSETEYPLVFDEVFDEEPNISYSGSAYESGSYGDKWYGSFIQPFYGYPNDASYYSNYVSYTAEEFELFKDDVPESLSIPQDRQDYSTRINSLLADICTTILTVRVPFVISISTSERETYFMDGGIGRIDP